MSILQYKYKAHRLVNTLFYIIVFVIGFVLGFGAKEINFNKLISQVLMIDNVQALDTTRYDCGSNCKELQNLPNIDNYSNYLFIEQLLNELNVNLETNFNISDYNYIIIRRDEQLYQGFLEEFYSFTFSKSKLIINDGQVNGTGDTIYFRVQIYESGTIYYILDLKNVLDGEFLYSSTPHTNENTIGTLNNEYSFELTNVFKEITFNENLFKDNPDFKEVCVPENSSFAITPTQGNYSDTGQYEDFIWFPYGLNNGLLKVQYDSSSEYTEGNIVPYPEETMREHFYFSNKEEINKFYDKDLPSDFENAGYTDKYSYYGYDAYKIFIVYKNGLFRYPIFTFDNPSKLTISSSGTIHGGGDLRLDGDEEIEISTDYCFYIKNGYDVSLVNLNEWGDFNGTVSSPDGDYNFNTSHNEFKSNTESFLTQPIKFINSMKDTINFINSLIYEFYISLPVLLRAFIITVFIILIIMLIMKIGGYN